jgi:Tfp pilus assembly protein PilF
MLRGRLPTLRLLLLAAMAVCCALAAPADAQSRIERVPGIVRNEDGQAVPGATVVAENARAEPHLFATTTDGEGSFVFTGLAAGAWTISVKAAGYVPGQATMLLSRGSSVPIIELVLRRAPWRPPPPLGGGRLEGVDVFRLTTALQNADTLMRAGQYDEAIAAYREVLAQAPALTRANLAIGDAFRAMKDLEQAAAAYGDALASEPGNEMAVLGLAAIAVDRGAPEQADRLLTEAAARPKAGREVFCALGDVKLRRQQVVAASEWYARAASADPTWAVPPLKLGALAASRGDAAAVGYLETAIRLAPGSPEAAEAARLLAELRK